MIFLQNICQFFSVLKRDKNFAFRFFSKFFCIFFSNGFQCILGRTDKGLRLRYGCALLHKPRVWCWQNGLRVKESTFENERWIPLEGFCSKLLPTDRPHYSSMDGLQVFITRREASFPFPRWSLFLYGWFAVVFTLQWVQIQAVKK